MIRYRAAAVALAALGALATLAAVQQRQVTALYAAVDGAGNSRSGLARFDAQALGPAGTTRGVPHDGSGEQAYLVVPGVTGPATVGPAKGVISVTSFGYGAQLQESVGGIGAGKPKLMNLTITKRIDVTSPVFSNHYFTGEPFAGVTKLAVVRTVQDKSTIVEEISLDTLAVLADAIDTSTGEPVETMTLGYRGLQDCVTPILQTGQPGKAVCATFDYTPPTPTPPPPTPSPTPSPSPSPTHSPTPTPTATPTPNGIVEYPITTASSGPELISVIDGTIYFAENTASKIATITTDGTVAETDTNTGPKGPVQIAQGPLRAGYALGTLFFTESTAMEIGTFNEDGVTMGTEYSGLSGAPFSLAADSSGYDEWFTENGTGKIGAVLSGGVVQEFSLPTTNSGPREMALNSYDTDLWFTESTANQLAKVSSGADITEFTAMGLAAGSVPWGITEGNDGNMWFTENGSGKIGVETSDGTSLAHQYPLSSASSGPMDITLGPDDNVWFTENDANKIGSITTSGTITEYTVPTPGSQPYGIVGWYNESQCYIFFTEYHANKVGRLPVTCALHVGIRRHGFNGARAAGSVRPRRPPP